jgi:type II secretory pathway component PulJ
MNRKGFTLVEVLVSTFFMAMMMIVVSGILVHNLRLQQFSLERQELLSEVSYALEYMSRSIRMARPGDETNYTINGDSIEFNHYESGTQKFYLANDKLYEQKGVLDPVNLTSDKLKVHAFDILVQGDESQQQPLVTIIIEASLVDDADASIKVQTSISQRSLNI